MTAPAQPTWPEPDWQDHDVRVFLGDARTVLATLPAESVQCVVTSPPYYGLRDYGHPGQLGAEPDVGTYVASLVGVMDELWRVLRRDGTVWLNLGDTYSGRANAGSTFDRHRGSGHREGVIAPQQNRHRDAPHKSLIGVPDRVKIALIDEGWIVRNEVAWAKPNGMPEPVTDRLASRHEKLFLLSKRPTYAFDLDALREPLKHPDAADGSRVFGGVHKGGKAGVDATARRRGGNRYTSTPEKGRNPGDVWTITTKPYKGAHFATMPWDLVRRCVTASTPSRPDGLVLDPFAGSGTTLQQARALGLDSVGIELNPEYLPLIIERVGASVLDFT